MFKHSLLPIDGSELSLRAVTAGVELAPSCGARVLALQVVPTFPAFIYMSEALAAAEPTYIQESIALARGYLAQMEQLAAQAEVRCSGNYEVAERSHEIIRQTVREKACELVVTASRGRRGRSRWLPGSETQKVLPEGDVPALVCR